jgi:predicted flap endonuclease-1-like 5' DNA nuclease
MDKEIIKPSSNCPITADPLKREEANRTTAAIKENLPDGLAQPALRALAAAGINALTDFAKFTESDLAKLHGIGPNALIKIKKSLAEQGLTFLP